MAKKETPSMKERAVEADAIIAAMGDGLLLLDKKGKIITVNPAFEKFCGYTKKELVGRIVARFIPLWFKKGDIKKALGGFREVIAGKVPTPRVLTMRSRDGRETPFSFTPTFIKDSKGKRTHIVVTVKDITEIKRMEKRLVHQKGTIENIFKFVPEGLLVFSDKHTLLKENAAFNSVIKEYSGQLDYSEEELRKIILKQVKKKLASGEKTVLRIPKKGR